MQPGTEREILRRILSPVAPELAAVERLLHSLVAGPDDHDWLGTTVSALLDAGGKRLRPALVLLSAQAGTYDPAAAVPAATALELLHLASLVHDDVIDRGTLRRGFPTVNARWGDPLAILTGDYLFAKALATVADLPPRATRQLAAALGQMVAGEVGQQLGRGGIPGVDEYLKRIGQKTASLTASCCRIGALAGQAPAAVVERLAEYGWWFGMTYQLVDDLLDVRGNPSVLGKAVGMDAAREVATLPAVLAAAEANGGSGGAPVTREAALEAAEAMAADFAARARSKVADIKPRWLRETFEDLAGFVLERSS